MFTLKSPFEVKVGDQIVTSDGQVWDVIESGSYALTVGGAILDRDGREAQIGDRWYLNFQRPDGTETGASGRYDGNTCFRVRN